MEHSLLRLISTRSHPNGTRPWPSLLHSSECYSALPQKLQVLMLRSPEDARVVEFVVDVMLASLPPLDDSSNS